MQKMEGTQKKNYYDVIAGLSAFEKSNEVTLSIQELEELTSTKKDDTEKDNVDSITKKKILQEDEKKSKMIVHGYLGGKVDLSHASNATYDLSHCLLGGFVPKPQLETLSSVDFANYFHRSLECENALEVYDFLVGNEYRHVQQQQLKQNQDSEGYKSKNENAVRKVIVCKKCNSKFKGQNRLRMLYNHICNSKINK
ncbi:hypothetical protein TPHA_0F00680 [Tetrapisispora phaffii CBS 4417]|uniref:Uncharacterized protein n=1 Tax=Tetrapisispora phaffii (strain ATCC 24235 / CBS 4417 / NBRC 1672 / NRRL Y-8282 / UCD 70-5) TaxID=1071381 RepID=G8BUX2_TETPH|nr:hypothetical protein TPHA_0F00680 [Tetrapisispora phaffii CBS 4417]CCE63554.1 hypothetical protein TPHA_0F00680 [Tetrapisispora phaffii CBS 4417]